ncbi:MAG: HD domain-containing protein [Actinobacteria bacterium]|nr:HD domain-containing protein [Actinomycetota bacterium]
MSRVLASDPLAEIRAALAETPAAGEVWVVGGTLRDALIGRSLTDVDLAVSGDVKRAAQAVHGRVGGDIFGLSERFGTWRVQPASAAWTIDLTALRGDTIEQDLALRDFSVNAMAAALSGGPGDLALLDPHGGLGDLEARVLRVLGEQAYVDDPLRPLRLARLAAVLDFSPDSDTALITRRHALAITNAAAERVFAELRGLVDCDGVLRGIELLDELGLMAAAIPELAALRGVEQSVYHHLDAYGHTIDVLGQLTEIQADPEPVFGAAAEAVAERLNEPLAEGLSRGGALRWAALLHDIAKRETRTEYGDGHVGFPDHDKRGAKLAQTICRRLNAAERFTQYVCALTREHLRLGFLVKERPLSRRQVYAYMRACQPVEVEVGVLSAADRLATRGRKADAAIGSHLELVRELNDDALAWRSNRAAEPLVRGGELATALAIKPGPRLGELLAEIDEARFVGEVLTREDALAFARARI